MWLAKRNNTQHLACFPLTRLLKPLYIGCVKFYTSLPSLSRYVAATSTFTHGLFDGVPDIHGTCWPCCRCCKNRSSAHIALSGGELCDRSRRRRYMLRNTADTSEHWKRLRLVCRRMRRKIRAVEATVDPAVGQAVVASLALTGIVFSIHR